MVISWQMHGKVYDAEWGKDPLSLLREENGVSAGCTGTLVPGTLRRVAVLEQRRAAQLES